MRYTGNTCYQPWFVSSWLLPTGMSMAEAPQRKIETENVSRMTNCEMQRLEESVDTKLAKGDMVRWGSASIESKWSTGGMSLSWSRASEVLDFLETWKQSPAHHRYHKRWTRMTGTRADWWTVPNQEHTFSGTLHYVRSDNSALMQLDTVENFVTFAHI